MVEGRCWLGQLVIPHSHSHEVCRQFFYNSGETCQIVIRSPGYSQSHIKLVNAALRIKTPVITYIVLLDLCSKWWSWEVNIGGEIKDPLSWREERKSSIFPYLIVSTPVCLSSSPLYNIIDQKLKCSDPLSLSATPPHPTLVISWDCSVFPALSCLFVCL